MLLCRPDRNAAPPGMGAASTGVPRNAMSWRARRTSTSTQIAARSAVGPECSAERAGSGPTHGPAIASVSTAPRRVTVRAPPTRRRSWRARPSARRRRSARPTAGSAWPRMRRPGPGPGPWRAAAVKIRLAVLAAPALVPARWPARQPLGGPPRRRPSVGRRKDISRQPHGLLRGPPIAGRATAGSGEARWIMAGKPRETEKRTAEAEVVRPEEPAEGRIRQAYSDPEPPVRHGRVPCTGAARPDLG
jgi:hypothetical protein